MMSCINDKLIFVLTVTSVIHKKNVRNEFLRSDDSIVLKMGWGLTGYMR